MWSAAPRRWAQVEKSARSVRTQEKRKGLVEYGVEASNISITVVMAMAMGRRSDRFDCRCERPWSRA